MSKKILISGIDYGNYGSVCMLHVARNQIAARGQSSQVYELCHVPDNEIPGIRTEKNQTIYFQLRVLLVVLITPKFLRFLLFGRNVSKVLELFSKKPQLFDISGFALSSKFKWVTWLRFLLPIMCALKYRGSVTIVPQSFGPFDDSAIRSFLWVFKLIIKNKDVRIFARDKSSKRYLREVGIDCELRLDSVFGMSEIDASPNRAARKNCGIVLNSHLFDDCSDAEVLEVYTNIAKILSRSGYSIYLFQHTLSDDYEFSVAVAEVFKKQGCIVTFEKKNLELNELIAVYQSIDLIVTSRFHSMLLALSSSVPCYVLGWSDKYEELAKLYQQSDYCASVADFSKESFIKFLDEENKLKNTLRDINFTLAQQSDEELKDIYNGN